jgi:hypothetical protein
MVVVHCFFCILIRSFGSAMTFPHFLHFTVSNGSYMGIKTLTLLGSIGRLFNENLVYCNPIPMTTIRTFHSKMSHHIKHFHSKISGMYKKAEEGK